MIFPCPTAHMDAPTLPGRYRERTSAPTRAIIASASVAPFKDISLEEAMGTRGDDRAMGRAPQDSTVPRTGAASEEGADEEAPLLPRTTARESLMGNS